MIFKKYIKEIDPVTLLWILQNEDAEDNVEKTHFETLMNSIENSESKEHIKNNLTDLLYTVVSNYYVRGMRDGAQLYVSLLEKHDLEDIC